MAVTSQTIEQSGFGHQLKTHRSGHFGDRVCYGSCHIDEDNPDLQDLSAD
jgi:hypothetical protein